MFDEFDVLFSFGVPITSDININIKMSQHSSVSGKLMITVLLKQSNHQESLQINIETQKLWCSGLGQRVF